MSIMECKEHGQDLNMSTDPMRCRTKLRPLMPRPITRPGTNSDSCSATPTPCWCLRNPNFPAWNQPSSSVRDYGVKTEMSTAPLVSSRWTPTPEQLQALEEMYRRGTRTPSAEQIQQIAAKLRRFGKIEGKNVFYWFQNHKARERQKKRRRELELLAGKKTRHVETPEPRQSARLIEHPEKLPAPSSYGATLEHSVSMHGAAVVEEFRQKEGWTQLDHEELLLQTVAAKIADTSCWQLDLSSCMSPNNSVHKITTQKGPGQENAEPIVPLNRSNLLLPSRNVDFVNAEKGVQEDQTLQLFPVNGNILNAPSTAEEESGGVSSMGTAILAPNQFFEFLPTKK